MVLEVKNARKSFGKNRVVDNVSFTANRGEIIGIFGLNGSGKSTLLKLIFGTLKGTIDLSIDGRSIAPRDVIRKQRIGYLPQHTFLPKRAKVRDVIPMYFYEGEIQDRIFYDPFIATFTHLRIGELSLGQQRYLGVNLLSQLPHPFILLDEPFTMIDPLEKEKLKVLIKSLKKSKGILVTDHYYQDVLEVSDTNFAMTGGTLSFVNGEEDLAKMGYLAHRMTVS